VKSVRPMSILQVDLLDRMPTTSVTIVAAFIIADRTDDDDTQADGWWDTSRLNQRSHRRTDKVVTETCVLEMQGQS
jgi:hypothetical protein